MPPDPTAGIIVGGRVLRASDALHVTNYKARGVHRFTGPRMRRVKEVVVHESVTRSEKATIHVLKKKRKGVKLGIHFTVAADGQVFQHADLLDRMNDAGVHNPAEVGIEVTNPFYPRNLTRRTPWERVIDAPWADGGAYVVPLPEQAESTAQLLRWLIGYTEGPIQIPDVWVGRNVEFEENETMAMARIPQGKKRRPGVWAHTYWGHSDGSWPVLYAWLRLCAGVDAARAYEWAISLATGVQDFVDLGPVFTWSRREPNTGPSAHD